MTLPAAPARSTWWGLRPLAGELATLGSIGLLVVAPHLVSDVFGSETAGRLVGLLLVAAPFACLWGFAKIDLVGFVSIAGPVEVLGAVAFVTGWSLPWLIGAILFLAWVFVGNRIWPWWSREVLRRMRRDTPEAEVVAASRRIFGLWRGPMTQESHAAITREIQDLDRLSTPRTIAYINGLQAAWDFRPDSALDDRGRRISARLADEYDRLWRGPQISVRGGNRALALRPTRGTRLEFRFPHLEALVAIATNAEQHEMAGRAAAMALREVGMALPELEEALRQVAAGYKQPEARREVEEQLQIVLDELLPMYDRPDPDADERGVRLARQANALGSAESALAIDLSPRDVADAVYSAITADLANEDEFAYEALLTAIVGNDRAAQAVEVEPSERRTSDQDGASESFVGPMLALIGRSSATRRGLLGLAGIGIVAGVLGTVIRQGIRPLSDGLPDRGGADIIVGALAVGLVAYVLLRIRSGRPGFYDLPFLILLALVAQALLDPAFTASEDLLSPLDPDAWTSLFYGNPWGAVPYSPWHGLLYAAVLVVAGVLLRRFATLPDRARSQD